MNVTLHKVNLKGNINVITSKSYAHRYLLAAMLSKNSVTISKINFNDDVKASLSCLASFGATYKIFDDNVTIFNDNNYNDNPIFNCNESGSTLRFFIPISLVKYDKVTFKGSKRLIERGISVYEDIFKKQGIIVNKSEDEITISGKLKADTFVVDGSISSQFITGLLFALPLLNNDSVIKILPPINSKNYIDITLDVLNKACIKYEIKENSIYIKGNQTYNLADVEVEADYSNAAFLLAFNYFNNDINIANLNVNSLQADKICVDYFDKLNKSYQVIDIENCIDLGPILMVFAALKHGAKFINTKRLKIKESSRDKAIKQELEKVGVNIIVNDNDVIVNKSKLTKSNIPFSSCNDHRIVMALSLLSCMMDITINDYQAINKSYPNYFKELEKLGAVIDYEIE